jgi:hypothetical protein
VIKLHRQWIFKKIAPERHVEEQPRALRHQSAVDERPGVVCVSGAQPRD